MHELALLKNLANCCALENIWGLRATFDTAIDNLMGGKAKCDWAFVTLMSSVILDQIETTDDTMFNILTSMKDRDLLTPVSVARSTPKESKELVKHHDVTLNATWMV